MSLINDKSLFNYKKLVRYAMCCGLINLTFSGCAVLSTFNSGESSKESQQAASAYGAKPVPAALAKAFQEALALQDAGHLDQARQAFEQLYTNYPDYSGAAVNLAILSMPADPAKARYYLQAALKRNGNNYQAHHLSGVLARQAFEFETAKNHYQRAIEIKPDYASAWYNLAVLNEIYLGNFSAAITAYEMLLTLDQTDEDKIKKRIEKLKRIEE